MPSRADKVSGHTGHLVDAFVRLRATYALLDPLLFDSELRARWRTGAGARGRDVLVNALTYACVLDASNLALDGDSRTPSLRSLDASLDDRGVVDECCKSFAEWNLPPGSDDPDVVALVLKMEAKETEERKAQFYALVSEFRHGWSELASSNALAGFKTLRDKVIAHNELHHVDGKYHALDVSSLGLTFQDLRTLVEALEPLVNQANLIFRAASYDFDDTKAQLRTAAEQFWLVLREQPG